MAYTARGVMEAVLTELNKVNAPSILLDDFNYFFNKAIQQFVNKQYNIYDVNQQTTDNMRVLKAGALLKPKKAYQYADFTDGSSGVVGDDVKMLDSLYGATYEVDLPDDYFHLLNCVCIYRLKKRDGCHNAGDYWNVAAQRLTADLWAGVLNNLYARPLPRRPYYYIHNVNVSPDRPTNPVALDSNGQIIRGTDVTPNVTYNFELDKYVINVDSNSHTASFSVTSTKKENTNDPINLDYTINIRNTSDWQFINVNKSTGEISIAENPDSKTRYGYIDFVQAESNRTLTITITQSAKVEPINYGYVYYGVGVASPSNSTTLNNSNKKLLTSKNYSFQIPVVDSTYVWIAYQQGQTVTIYNDMNQVVTGWANADPSAIIDGTGTTYVVKQFGSLTGSQVSINNTYTVKISSN